MKKIIVTVLFFVAAVLLTPGSNAYWQENITVSGRVFTGQWLPREDGDTAATSLYFSGSAEEVSLSVTGSPENDTENAVYDNGDGTPGGTDTGIDTVDNELTPSDDSSVEVSSGTSVPNTGYESDNVSDNNDYGVESSQ